MRQELFFAMPSRDHKNRSIHENQTSKTWVISGWMDFPATFSGAFIDSLFTRDENPRRLGIGNFQSTKNGPKHHRRIVSWTSQNSSLALTGRFWVFEIEVLTNLDDETSEQVSGRDVWASLRGWENEEVNKIRLLFSVSLWRFYFWAHFLGTPILCCEALARCNSLSRSFPGLPDCSKISWHRRPGSLAWHGHGKRHRELSLDSPGLSWIETRWWHLSAVW
jgi:hypothetical protein